MTTLRVLRRTVPPKYSTLTHHQTSCKDNKGSTVGNSNYNEEASASCVRHNSLGNQLHVPMILSEP